MLLKKFSNFAGNSLLVLAALAVDCSAQMNPVVTIAPVPTIKAKKGSVTVVSIRAVLPPGFHANSNTPTDAYLIPLKLTWTTGPLQADGITYPKSTLEKYSFSDKPLSVVTGEFTITTKFKIPDSASSGPAAQNGTLRYQACNDHMCFAPKTVPVVLSLNLD